MSKMTKLEEKIIPKLAFKLLTDIQDMKGLTGSKKEDLLKNLHSFFGETFVHAAELLDKCKIARYSPENGLRNVYKIMMSTEGYMIYEDINYCQCDDFSLKVLESMENLTCKHVLAVHLGRYFDRIVKETVTGSQLMDFLNINGVFE